MLKLSHSGSGVLKACERKFFHRYISKSKRDPDAPSFAAANRGSVLHSCWEYYKTHGLELCLGNVEREAEQYIHTSLDKTTGYTHTVREVSPTVDVPRILACLLKYKKLDDEGKISYSGRALKEIAWEVRFQLKYTQGFLDAILIDEERATKKVAI